MTPQTALDLIIRPVCTAMGVRFSTPPALTQLLAIALEESRLQHRIQLPAGPAHGLWQFEMWGGCAGVLGHPVTAPIARRWCAELLVPALAGEVHRALVQNDLLACVFARLLLFSDSHPLPTDERGGWDYYLRNWRPGKPSPDSWAANWRTACAAVEGGP